MFLKSLEAKPIIISNFIFRHQDWADQIYPGEIIDKLSMTAYLVLSYTKELSKFRTGYLLKEILDRSTEKLKNQLNPNRSAWMYSSHDTVIISLLQTLGVFNVRETFSINYLKRLQSFSNFRINFLDMLPVYYLN